MASHNVSRPAIAQAKTEEQHQAELAEIISYQTLVDLIESKIAGRQYTSEVLQLTSRLLTKNPEYYSIWNVRRRLLISGLFSESSDSSLPLSPSLNISQTATTSTSLESSSSSTSNSQEASKATPLDRSPPNLGKSGTILELIQNDLAFVVPLLRQWPKCYWIWNHRIWLLEQATLRLDVKVARRLWQEELGLCGIMLVKDSRNFHGWGYRRMVIARLESEAFDGKSMVEAEFAYTTKMVNAHLSNFSAWHSRSKLIPNLLDERHADDAARREFLDNEFDIMRNALWTDSNDQSLWFYYQFLMTTLIDPAGYATIVPNFSPAERAEYVESQLVDLRDLLDGAEDCKWIYNALLEYTIANCKMQDRLATEQENEDLRAWLAELRKLDPKRTGRWDDLEKALGILGK